jgi:hypothetical protein
LRSSASPETIKEIDMTDALRDKHPDRRPDEGDRPDASDIVEGPVGSARLREPSEVEAEDAGADLEQLPHFRSTGANAQARMPKP